MLSPSPPKRKVDLKKKPAYTALPIFNYYYYYLNSHTWALLVFKGLSMLHYLNFIIGKEYHLPIKYKRSACYSPKHERW